jgi:hypothetical protein
MNAYPMLLPELQRGDRIVGRVRMRLAPEASQTRVRLLLEEALRLATLPGEDQGKAFYFRRIALMNLPSAASREVWLESCNSALKSMAVKAVHGRQVGAADSEAVYFLSQQEAMEWFLGSLVARPDTLPWYAPAISGVPRDAASAAQFVALIERLRRLPAGWFAAATALFVATKDSAEKLASLVATVAPDIAERWLEEMGNSPDVSHGSLSISTRKRIMLRHMFLAFGSTPQSSPVIQNVEERLQLDPRMLWLVALAIVAEHPAELQRGTVVASATKLLEVVVRDAAPTPVKRCEEEKTSLDSMRSDDEYLATISPGEERFDSATDLNQLLNGSLPTEAGGLYFLLNVLQRLGIERTLERTEGLVAAGFLPHLIVALGEASGVPLEDAAFQWAQVALELADDEKTFFSKRFHAIDCVSFTQGEGSINGARLLRMWVLMVRRWCWRNAGVRLSEVVCRPGQIAITETELDVTLPLEDADLRLRRVGLDLDPGWLPWFGRVVRFHYERSSLGGSLR